MRTLSDNVYDNISWWHPRSGPLTVETLTTRANHNGFPEATRQDVINTLDALADQGSINKGWY